MRDWTKRVKKMEPYVFGGSKTSNEDSIKVFETMISVPYVSGLIEMFESIKPKMGPSLPTLLGRQIVVVTLIKNVFNENENLAIKIINHGPIGPFTKRWYTQAV